MGFLSNVDLNFIAFLIAVCVIVGLFLKNKDNITKEKLHLFYISGILVLIIVCVISFFCVNNDREGNLYNYLSFASTLTSIILSVLAIIITVLSNNSMDNLKNAIEKVKELPTDIKSAIEKPLEEINSSTEKLQQMVTETKSAQATNNEATQNILQKIEDHLTLHDRQFEQVSSQLKAQSNDILEGRGETETLAEDLKESQVSAYLNILPNAFLFLVKVADITAEKYPEKYVSFKEIGRITGMDENSVPGIHLYYYSAAMSFHALNLLDFESKDNNMDEVKFTRISPTIKKVYESRFSNIENGDAFTAAIEAYLEGNNSNEKAGEEQ